MPTNEQGRKRFKNIPRTEWLAIGRRYYWSTTLIAKQLGCNTQAIIYNFKKHNIDHKRLRAEYEGKPYIPG